MRLEEGGAELGCQGVQMVLELPLAEGDLQLLVLLSPLPSAGIADLYLYGTFLRHPPTPFSFSAVTEPHISCIWGYI